VQNDTLNMLGNRMLPVADVSVTYVLWETIKQAYCYVYKVHIFACTFNC
jgi:hypothetical protein